MREKAKKQMKCYACDFETTVYKGQTSTEVWSAAITRIYGEDEEVLNFSDLTSFMDYILQNHKAKQQNYYFHNLKFDGEFIIYWLMSYNYKSNYTVKNPKDLKDYEFNTVISDMNQWYLINVKFSGRLYQFRDSLKLLPFSLAQIGKSFKTKHQKTSMVYEGARMPGYVPDDKELEYIKNDVLVLREALEAMFAEGFTGLTIGSCCMTNFKQTFYGPKNFKKDFPNLTEIYIDDEVFGDPDADSYIRRSYRGGWCYTRFPDHVFYNGHGETYDVNSLYPSMMHSMSGSVYPYGEPHFWTGKAPRHLLRNGKLNDWYYFFIRFECRFQIREGYLPFVSIKDSVYYKATEMLRSSQIFDKSGTPLRILDRKTGELKSNTVTLTMSCTDFELFLEHYDVKDLVILDGVWFNAVRGMFDDYIDHYMRMKIEASKNGDPVKRQIAKLCLNNIYGKFAASNNSSYKTPHIDPDSNCTEFEDVTAYDKTPGYIAIGAAITAYARRFTITAAQANYDYFRYADTDSIHLEIPEGVAVKGVKEDDNELCCWKKESVFDTAIFVRAKTYIEYSSKDDFYNIKCAGLPEHCKKLYEATIRFRNYDERIDWLKSKGELLQSLTPSEIDFLKEYHTIEDFRHDFVIPGKLMPVHLPGGVLLRKVNFTIR